MSGQCQESVRRGVVYVSGIRAGEFIPSGVAVILIPVLVSVNLYTFLKKLDRSRPCIKNAIIQHTVYVDYPGERAGISPARGIVCKVEYPAGIIFRYR